MPQEVVVGQHRPLGRPVVPNVYMRQARSLPATSMPSARGSPLASTVRSPPRRRRALRRPPLAPAPRRPRRQGRRGRAGTADRPHEDVGAGIGQQEGHLRRGQPEVHRHEDRAELGGGEHRLQEGGAVEEQTATLSPCRTPNSRSARRVIGPPVERRSDATVPVDQRDPVSGKKGSSSSPAADPGQAPAEIRQSTQSHRTMPSHAYHYHTLYNDRWSRLPD